MSTKWSHAHGLNSAYSKIATKISGFNRVGKNLLKGSKNNVRVQLAFDICSNVIFLTLNRFSHREGAKNSHPQTTIQGNIYIFTESFNGALSKSIYEVSFILEP